MAETREVSGTAVFVTLVGFVLAYSAVKNSRITDTLRSFLAGNAPAGGDAGASGAGTGIPPPVSGAGGSNFTTIRDYMLQIGFSTAGAAGALGNLQIESSFSPTAYNSGEKAIGIAQWEKGRRTALQTYARSHGGMETDLNIQLGYMRLELGTGFMPIYLAMRVARDPRSAANTWNRGYEISGDYTQDRENAASAIYSSMISGGVR